MIGRIYKPAAVCTTTTGLVDYFFFSFPGWRCSVTPCARSLFSDSWGGGLGATHEKKHLNDDGDATISQRKVDGASAPLSPLTM